MDIIHNYSTNAYAANQKKLLQIENHKDSVRSINDEKDNVMALGIMEQVPKYLIRFQRRPDIINLWLIHKAKFSDVNFLKDK